MKLRDPGVRPAKKEAVRLGFIGTGGYALRHLEGFGLLQEQGLVSVSALADPSAAALRAAASMFPSAATFSGYLDLLEGRSLDGIIISAPIPWHEEITMAALDLEIPVLLEKPPVPVLSQLERLIAADPERRVMVGFQHLYSEGLRSLKRRILAGEVGRLESMASHGLWPRAASYYSRAPWAGRFACNGRPVLDGPCTNAFAHFLHDLLFLGGASEREIAIPDRVRGELYRARPIPSYDTGCLVGNLPGGPLIQAGFSHAGSEAVVGRIVVTGNRGSLVFDEEGRVRSSLGVSEADDGRDATLRAFVEFCRGRHDANWTPLESMRGYLVLTNLMFQSAEGISNIPSDHLTVLHRGSPDEQYVVENLPRALSHASRSCVSLSEAGMPWGRKTPEISRDELSEDSVLAADHQACCRVSVAE